MGKSLLEAGYVSEAPSAAPKIVSAAVSLQASFGELRAKISKRYKGNFLREAKKAQAVAIFGLFEPSAWAEDIEAINKSLPERCGRPMRAAYHRTAYELRGAYAKEPSDKACASHWSIWYGVFFNCEPGAKLVAYCQLRRCGELCLYSTVLGHGQHLGEGAMPYMHLEILKEIDLGGRLFEGLKWLMYAGWNDGGEGLQLWKKKAGFDPVMFVNFSNLN